MNEWVLQKSYYHVHSVVEGQAQCAIQGNRQFKCGTEEFKQERLGICIGVSVMVKKIILCGCQIPNKVKELSREVIAFTKPTQRVSYFDIWPGIIATCIACNKFY